MRFLLLLLLVAQGFCLFGQVINVNRKKIVGPLLSLSFTADSYLLVHEDPVSGNPIMNTFMANNNSEVQGNSRCLIYKNGNLIIDSVVVGDYAKVYNSIRASSFATGGYFDYLKVHIYDGVLSVPFIIDLSPSTPYLNGCNGNVNPADLIYDGINFNSFFNAVHTVFRNAMCVSGASSDYTMWIFNAINKDIALKSVLKHEPTGLWSGFDKNFFPAEVRYTTNGSSFVVNNTVNFANANTGGPCNFFIAPCFLLAPSPSVSYLNDLRSASFYYHLVDPNNPSTPNDLDDDCASGSAGYTISSSISNCTNPTYQWHSGASPPNPIIGQTDSEYRSIWGGTFTLELSCDEGTVYRTIIVP